MLTTEEKLLVQKIREGNKDAFNRLYSLYWDGLYGFALKMTTCVEEAEEIVQDIFVDIWIKRSTLQINQTIKGYLFTAFKFKLIDKIRKNKLQEKYADHITRQLNLEHVSSPEQKLISRERVSLLMNSTQLLPEKCQQVFILRRIENYSIAEIADTLAISPQTVKNHLNKAFKIMKPVYEKVAAAMLL